MQVVYSGGSNTPTPSPRLQRKIGYGRPVMPGYMTHVHPQILVQRSREKLTEGDTTLRDSIPAMSTCVASLCLVLNIFIPGSGTLTAGLSVLCCSRIRPKGGTKRHCILLNAGVALMQFMLTFLFLLGWIWSITWGVAFLSISRKYQRRGTDEEKRHHQRSSEGKGQGKPRDKSSYSPSSSPSKKHPTGHCDHQHHNNHSHHHQHQHHHHHHNHHHQHQCQHPPSPCHHHHQHHHQHVQQHSRESSISNCSSKQGNSPRGPFKRDLSPKSSPDTRHKSNNNLEIITSTTASVSHPYQRLTPPTASKHNSESMTSVLPQPIIVLQKAPEHGGPEGAEDRGVKTAPNEAIMQARTRHMKMLQRKMSDNDLSPFVLTNQQLEAIVIHDLPVVNSNGNFRQSSNADTSDGLPKL